MQLAGYNFSEKYKAGGVIGVLGSDKVQLGSITMSRASLGLVTQASVDLMGASCAGMLVRAEKHLWGCPCMAGHHWRESEPKVSEGFLLDSTTCPQGTVIVPSRRMMRAIQHYFLSLCRVWPGLAWERWEWPSVTGC